MATNILAGMQYAQQQGELGRQQGRQQRFNRLAGQAYSAPSGEQRNALLGQAVGVDPAAGVTLGTQLQTAEDNQLKKLAGAARNVIDAYKSGNAAQTQGAYRATLPLLTRLTAQHGKTPPPEFSEDMLPAMYQVIAQAGGDNVTGMPSGFREFELTARAAGLQPGTPEYEQAANIALGREGRASNAGMGFKVIKGADGRERISRQNPRTGAVEIYNEQTGDFEPIGGAEAMGAPAAQADPMAPLLQQANQAVQLGADPDKVEAWLQQQAQSMGLQPQAPGMMPQSAQGAPAAPQSAPPSVTGLAVSRTPEEEAAAVEAAKQQAQIAALPQREKIETDALRDRAAIMSPKDTEALEAKKAAAQRAKTDAVQTYDQSIGQIDSLLKSPGFAQLGTFKGDVSKFIPHTDAANASALLENVQNQIMLNTMTKLKSLSATGATGFGQLSNKEGEALRNSIATLSTAQTNEQLRQNILKVRDVLERSKQTIAGSAIKFDDSTPATSTTSGWSIREMQ